MLCWLGLPMVLYWGKMQLLDRSWLLDHPFECLLYLHSQTPLLNTLAMFIAHASALTGLAEAAIASALFGLLAFGCFALLLEVAQLATGSRLASAICGAALLANPAFAFYRHRLLYEIPAMLAVLLVTWGFLCFVREGRGRDWIGLIVALALLCVTKSLFHPLLALAIALLALAARHFSARTPLRDLARRCAPGFALGIALVVLWPAKNALVFGQFVSSSWLGFNLIVRTPVEPYEPFVDFIERAQIHASLEPQIARFEPLFAGDDLEVVLALKKPSHPKIPNWNHLAVLYTSGELVRRGLAWRFANFGEWMRMTAGRYFMTMRASFVFPYSAKRLFRASKRFNAYAKRYRDFIHPDLRPWLERAFPNWFVHRYAVIIDAPIPYTPWAFAYPPLLLAFALVALRRRREPLGGFLALCALASAWTILVPALTDGAEGNRMRLATAPLVSVGAYALAQLATRWLRGRRRA
ncbi:MAG TPA: hypothetical protein VEC18_02685 [Myxococcota bacterium]|nr:hypothetical protein [Myxococcota bacterium]